MQPRWLGDRGVARLGMCTLRGSHSWDPIAYRLHCLFLGKVLGDDSELERVICNSEMFAAFISRPSSGTRHVCPFAQ